MMIPEVLTPRQQAQIMATGFLTVIFIGVAGCIALVFLAMWAVAQFALLVIGSLAEIFMQIGATFQYADPFTRLLIIVCLSLAGYWIARKVRPLCVKN